MTSPPRLKYRRVSHTFAFLLLLTLTLAVAVVAINGVQGNTLDEKPVIPSKHSSTINQLKSSGKGVGIDPIRAAPSTPTVPTSTNPTTNGQHASHLSSPPSTLPIPSPSPQPPSTSLLSLPPASVSVPGVSDHEVAVRLLLNQESHMAEAGPRLLFGIGRFIFYTFFLVTFILWWYQGALLYMPSFGRLNESKQTCMNGKGFRLPSEHGLNSYEECWITTEDGTKIHSWLILQPAPSSAPTIIFFHGNAGNIGYRLPNAKSLYHTTRANIMLVDYRGYGHSAGEPTEHGLRLDAAGVLKYLRHERDANTSLPSIDLTRLYLFGRSLGGAVAIHAAYDDQIYLRRHQHLGDSKLHPPLAGIMLENTFCNLVEMVLVLASRLGVIPKEKGMIHTTPFSTFWRLFLSYLMTNRWPSLDYIGELNVPILVLSGLADELIPPTHSAGLFAAAIATETKQLYTVENGTHNDTFVRGGMAYYECIFDFMTRTSQIQANAQGEANL